MKIYKHIEFYVWAKSQGLTDEVLKKAIEEMDKGLYEASLGSGLYKKRVALQGKGKSGGSRTLVAFKEGKRHFLCMVMQRMFEQILVRKKKSFIDDLQKTFSV